MKKVWLVPVAAALVLVAARGGWQGGDEPLTVSVVRFYSPVHATTTIEGVCELRLAAVASGAAETVRYRVQISVRDSTGLELQQDTWSDEVPGAVARMRGATRVETFELPPAAAGRYQVTVRVIPETGSVVERSVEVRAYAARPPLSDLLLADSAWVGADTGTAAAGEIRRGSLVMRTAPVPRLSPAAARLSYYAEIYPWRGAALDGELTVAVLGPGGRSVVRTAPRPVRFDSAGGSTEGSLDLAGLPAGDYRLQLRVRLGDSALVDEARFAMAETVPATAAAPADSTANPFATANEAQLDSLYAPLVYLLQPREQGVYNTLAVSGKRNFLMQFWARRDPTHGTGVNTELVRFYAAVRFANQTFREGGAGQVSGWRTDRGRVFLRNGRWDEILKRPMASPAPYEVWKYTRGRQRFYVFVDRSGLGNYQLIYSNDRQESALPDWGRIIGSEDSIDVARFLGMVSQGVQ